MQGICRVYAGFMQAFCCTELFIVHLCRIFAATKNQYYESYFIKSMHLPYGHA